MKAITEQAQENSLRVRSIMKLYAEMKLNIHEITHSQYTVHLLDAMFHRPVFETQDLVSRSGIKRKTAMAMLKQLRENEILTVLREPSGRRSAILCFPKLLNIAEGIDIL